MKNYEPKQLVAISRYQNYFPTLPAEIREDVYARMSELIEEEKAYCDKGSYKVQAFLVPGHTLGHLCYLIDDELLFTGDSIALNQNGGWCFFDIFNYDSRMNMESLKALRKKLDLGKIRYVFTSHNGFTDDPPSAFRHIDTIPTLEKGRPFDETAPYDCFAEKEE